jgi:hypothetical protein
MLGLIKLIFCLVFDLFRSRATLEAEILVLRQQIIVLRRGRVGLVAILGQRQVGSGLGLRVVSKYP